MTHQNPDKHPCANFDCWRIYTEFLIETDSRPKNPPLKRISKEEFYKLVEKEPWHLFTNVYDEIEERNFGKVIWLPLCKEPLPLEEVMKLREQYKKNYESYLNNSL